MRKEKYYYTSDPVLDLSPLKDAIRNCGISFYELDNYRNLPKGSAQRILNDENVTIKTIARAMGALGIKFIIFYIKEDDENDEDVR